MTRIRNWKNRFHKRIYERGESYFNRGLVYNYKETDRMIRANVGRNADYMVTIYHDGNGNIQHMTCECPYAEEGEYCKHEAALLFKNNRLNPDPTEGITSLLRKKNSEPVMPPSRIRPFEADFAGKEHFFDLNRLTASTEIYDDAYEKAKKLIADKQVRTDYINEDFDIKGEPIIDACFRFSRFNIFVKLSHDKISSLKCQNTECYFKRLRYGFSNMQPRLCEHEVAVLILLKDYIIHNDPGDFTNASAKEFLSEFDLTDRNDADEKTLEDLSLEARLELNPDFMEVSFRTGAKKLLVIKDLSQFVRAYENKGSITMGSKTDLDLSQNRFFPEDVPLYEFLKENVAEEENKITVFNANSYEYYKEEVGKSFALYGRRIDDFFDLHKNKTVNFTDRRGRNKEVYDIGFEEREPKITFLLSDYIKDGRFEGLRLSGKLPKVIEGRKYLYYLEDHTLCRFSRTLNEVFSLFPKKEKVDLIIGRKNLPQFYNHVLPILRKKIDIRNSIKEDFSQYLPMEASFDFYLDVRDGMICCLSNVTYEGKAANILSSRDDSIRSDSYGEKQVLDLLNTYFNIDETGALFISETSDDNISDILEDAIPAMMKLGDVHTTAAFDRLRLHKKMTFSVGVKIDNDLLQLDIESDDIDPEELAQIIDSYRLKKKYHKLKNGQLVRIDDENIEMLSSMFDTLNISLKDFVKGRMDIPVYRALYLNSLLEENDGIYEKRDEHFSNLVERFDQTADEDIPIPEGLEEIMRPYQKDGYRWLKSLSDYGFGGILADEMGLGKTLQMIAVLKDHRQNSEHSTSLIVCPSSLVYNWLFEVKKFSPDLDAAAVAGDQQERENIIRNYEDHDLLITSYDLLKRDIGKYEDCHFDYEVLDEAQYIKTYTTANAKSCKAIKAAHRFALTGTPIENNLSELWSIFDYLMPGFLYRYETFRNRFENRIVSQKDEAASQQLKKMIGPFILRRKKGDVLKDLPEKIEETIKVRFDSRQRRLYDSQVLKISSGISGSSAQEFRNNKIAILAELTKIRQICCEPSLVFENYDGESAKREACMELIRNAVEEGHKILLFSQFTSMLEILEEQLRIEGIAYCKLTGETDKKQRLKLVNDFNKDDTPLFLISLKAGGTGLNLTGADIVIHYDPWWNLAAQNQATDRAHRIGQEKIVTVYRIIAESSIEEKIIELQDKKSELVETMLSGENVSISSLSKDDLLELLN